MKTKASIFVLTFLLFLTSVASAEVLFVGTIYDSNANILSDSEVKITCFGNQQITTTALDGTYSISFNDTDCKANSSITFSVSKNSYISFNGDSSSENLIGNSPFSGLTIYVVDAMLSKESTPEATGTTGSNDRNSGNICTSQFWDCTDWSECEQGKQTRECISNCNTIKTENQDCSTENEENSTDQTEEIQIDPTENQEGEENSTTPLSAITGAFTGIVSENKGTLIGLVLFLAVLSLIYFSTKGKKEEEDTANPETSEDLEKEKKVPAKKGENN